MQCSECQEDSIIEIKWKDKRYCPSHFKRYFLAQLGEILNEYEVSGRICVAVSGGKDSSACVEALTHFDRLEVEPFHINLGIGEYSEKSLEYANELCEKLGLKLNTLSLEDEFGKTIPEINEREDGKICGICGMIKRYLINKYAYENDFDYVATGHNLSDELSSTFNNLANVYLTPFRGLEPVLEEKEKYKLVARAKPLYFLRDEDCRVYAEENEIPFYEGKCPLSVNSPTGEFKKWLHRMNSEMPRTMRNFAKSFIRIEKKMENEQEEHLRKCNNCGFATATETCRFCRIVRS